MLNQVFQYNLVSNDGTNFSTSEHTGEDIDFSGFKQIQIRFNSQFSFIQDFIYRLLYTKKSFNSDIEIARIPFVVSNHQTIRTDIVDSNFINEYLSVSESCCSQMDDFIQAGNFSESEIAVIESLGRVLAGTLVHENHNYPLYSLDAIQCRFDALGATTGVNPVFGDDFREDILDARIAFNGLVDFLDVILDAELFKANPRDRKQLYFDTYNSLLGIEPTPEDLISEGRDCLYDQRACEPLSKSKLFEVQVGGLAHVFDLELAPMAKPQN